MTDYYALLGVAPGATAAEIRRAYRRFAVKLHPDRNPGDLEAERKFKEIGRAYDALSHEDSRRKYDLERQGAVRPPPPPPPPNYPVADLSVDLELDPREFRDGCQKVVTVSRPRRCPDCGGTGRLQRCMAETCVLCLGSGCPSCGQTGRVYTDSCSRCWTSGTDRELTTITIHVPAGTPPMGRRRLVADGYLWGLRGPFYVDAYVRHKVQRPGLIVR